MSYSKHSFGKILFTILLTLMFSFSLFSFSFPVKAEAQTANDTQIAALVAQITQLQLILQQLIAAQGGATNTGNSSVQSCVELSVNLSQGSTDATTGGQVGKLQRFLTDTGHYKYGEITGYYGPSTEQAVQSWQRINGVVSSGLPETTGYGAVGPATRAAMARGCTTVTTPTQGLTPALTIASLTNITGTENPIVTGTAYGINLVGFSVASISGDKVYSSGNISVINNKWSHKISTDLSNGSYILYLYMNNNPGNLAQKKAFTVNTSNCVSGTATYPVGTKLTTIKLPNGTSSTIADGYYECQSSGSWKSVSTPVSSGKASALVEAVSTNIAAKIAPDGSGDVGYFTIKFEVTAVDNDVQVSNYANFRAQPGKDGIVMYDIKGPSGSQLVNDLSFYSSTLTSSASEDKFYGRFYVDEGSTEDFTLFVAVKPKQSGFYSVNVEDYLPLMLPNVTSGGNAIFARINTSDFTTKKLYLNVDTTPTIGCISGSQTYPVGKQLTTIVNANGTNSTISDGYYECQSDSTWKEISTYPTLSGINFTTAIKGLSVTADFGLTSGCDGYVIDWGDGQQGTRISNSSGPICTSIHTPVSLSHTYASTGNFMINLTRYTGSTKGAVTSKMVTATGGSTTNVSSTAPQKNYFSCNRSLLAAGQTYSDGEVACYGMWDYGNDFGGDVNMCGSYGGGTGCQIAVPICASGLATATKYYSNSGLSGTILNTVASNLQVTTTVAKSGVAGLWEYTCAPNNSFGYSSGSVLGASTSNLQAQLDQMKAILQVMLEKL